LGVLGLVSMLHLVGMWVMLVRMVRVSNEVLLLMVYHDIVSWSCVWVVMHLIHIEIVASIEILL
jgi:hypothetical protein